MYTMSLFSTSLLIMIFLLLVTGNGIATEDKNLNNTVQVQVVSMKGCVNTPLTIKLLHDVAKSLELHIDFSHVTVKTIDEAVRYRHLGSPTVQINGLDIDPTARELDQFGLT